MDAMGVTVEMIICAIDPGTTESAYVVWDGQKMTRHGKVDNEELLRSLIKDAAHFDCVVLEMIASYGMAVGETTFETCVWIGRFLQAVQPHKTARITRNEIKNHLCHSSRAKDANIRQAIIDRLGPVGTKKAPGACYGISGDVWSALAVALTWHDKYGAGSHA